MTTHPRGGSTTHARPAHVAPCGPAASLASVMVLNHQSVNTVLPGVKHMLMHVVNVNYCCSPSLLLFAFLALRS